MEYNAFLAFTDMDKEQGKEYVESHTAQIQAIGGNLEMQVDENDKVLLRLILPYHLADVAALPDFTWMPVRGVTVPVQLSTADIDELEGNTKAQ